MCIRDRLDEGRSHRDNVVVIYWYLSYRNVGLNHKTKVTAFCKFYSKHNGTITKKYLLHFYSLQKILYFYKLISVSGYTLNLLLS